MSISRLDVLRAVNAPLNSPPGEATVSAICSSRTRPDGGGSVSSGARTGRPDPASVGRAVVVRRGDVAPGLAEAAPGEASTDGSGVAVASDVTCGVTSGVRWTTTW